MNQGKLDMVKQEMVRINTDILRISYESYEQGWVNLIQMTTISTTVGKKPLEDMEYPHINVRI